MMFLFNLEARLKGVELQEQINVKTQTFPTDPHTEKSQINLSIGVPMVIPNIQNNKH